MINVSIRNKIQIIIFLSINLYFFTLSFKVFSQKHNNIWYFGNHAGLDFNSGAPVALLNGAMNTFEGCASVADTSGSLMFYTDGSTVWNQNHVVMSNGTGLHGDFTSTQSAIIVPKPLNNDIYYVFTIDAFAGPDGFQYSIVDMTAAGGLGAVTLKNIAVCSPVTEKVCAIRHANGIDVWVIVHDWGTAIFKSFLLTPSGFNTTPIISTAGTIHNSPTSPYNNAIGYMKSSPDGSFLALAICDDYIYEAFQFDDLTGLVSNPITFPNPDGSGSSGRAYGLEFSPNSKYLYLKNFYSSNIYQYDLTNFNSVSILASQVLVGSLTGAPSYYSGAMQLAPDGKIYIAKYQQTSLASISAPNNAGLACNFVDNAVSLNTGIALLGLPNLVSFTDIQNIVLHSGCFLGPINFWLLDTNYIQHYHWDFGDNSTLADTSKLAHPVYTYNQAGTYTVTVQVLLVSGSSLTYTSQITVSPPPNLISSDTLILCPGDSVNLTVNSNYINYLWSTGATSSGIYVADSGYYSITVTDSNSCIINDQVFIIKSDVVDLILNDTLTICNNDSIHVVVNGIFLNYLWNTGAVTSAIYVSDSGLYQVTVTDVNGCQINDHVYIRKSVAIDLISLDSLTICSFDTITLSNSNNIISILWNVGGSLPVLIVSDSGLYSVTVTDLNSCQYSDSVYVNKIMPPLLNLPQDTALCINDTLLVQPLISGNFDSLKWENGYTMPIRYITLQGQYSLSIYYKCGIITDNISITSKDCNSEIKFPNVFTPNHDAFNENFLPESDNVSDYVIHIYDRWGILLYESNDLLHGWDGTYKNRDCSAGVYYYIAEYTLFRNKIIHRERSTGVITLLR